MEEEEERHRAQCIEILCKQLLRFRFCHLHFHRTLPETILSILVKHYPVLTKQNNEEIRSEQRILSNAYFWTCII